MTVYNAKLQYINSLLCIEDPCQFDSLCDQVRSTTLAHLNQFILCLGTYFTPVNALSKKKRIMRRVMRKTRGLEVLGYGGDIIDLN